MVSNLRVKFKDGTEKLFENVVEIKRDYNIKMIEFDIEGNNFCSAINFEEVKYYEETKEKRGRAFIIHDRGDGTWEKVYIGGKEVRYETGENDED